MAQISQDEKLFALRLYDLRPRLEAFCEVNGIPVTANRGGGKRGGMSEVVRDCLRMELERRIAALPSRKRAAFDRLVSA